MHDEWRAGLLSNAQVVQALSQRVLCSPALVAEYKAGRLQLENDRLILAPGVDEQSATARD